LTAAEAAIEARPVAKSAPTLMNADLAAELKVSKLSRAACRRARQVSVLSEKVGVRTQLKRVT
jgi:hypothetical protein